MALTLEDTDDPSRLRAKGGRRVAAARGDARADRATRRFCRVFFRRFALGGAGQTNYAAANASLDALTALRQAEGAAGSIALQWGAVSGVGMGAATGADVQLQRRGLPPSARIWSAPHSAPLSKALARRPSPSPSSLPTGLATESGHQQASRRIFPRSPPRRRRLRRLRSPRECQRLRWRLWRPRTTRRCGSARLKPYSRPRRGQRRRG